MPTHSPVVPRSPHAGSWAMGASFTVCHVHRRPLLRPGAGPMRNPGRWSSASCHVCSWACSSRHGAGALAPGRRDPGKL
eukprot:9848111-Alexandrium_andersonii.AAC.1